MNQNNDGIFAAANEAMNLESLMQHIGDGEFVGRSKVCPFCADRKKRWGTFKMPNGTIAGKCFAPDCETDGKAVTQIGYLSMRRNISRKDAAKEFLRMAVPHLYEERAPRAVPQVSGESAHVAPAPQLPELPPFDATHGPWNALFTKLAPLLNEDDVKATGKKRGLDPETILLAGICPNREELEDYVHSIGEFFDDAELLECGIKKRNEAGHVYFSGKLKGWGQTGRKVNDKITGKKVPEYSAEMNPPLIPYFDGAGICTYMRPHKDYIVGVRDEIEKLDREFFKLLNAADKGETDHVPPCGAHPYLPPRFLENLRAWDGLCIITEGEFKALAADQAGIACMAFPGISFISNPAFRSELLDLFKSCRVEHAVIIFDNEVKDDPAYPDKYKADPHDQYDTQFYAEFTMRNLRPFFYGRGGSVRVGWLPDKLRKNGKADFDGILAHFVAGHGFEKGTDLARRVFEKCIENATDQPEKLKQSAGEDGLFPTRGRRIIENKLNAAEHPPALAFGGHREQQLAMQLLRTDASIEDKSQRRAIDKQLADALMAVVGCYFTRKKVEKEQAEMLRDRKTELNNAIAAERNKDKASQNADLMRSLLAARSAVAERIEGMPEAKSNFILRCEYALKTTGMQEFLVRVKRQGGDEWGPLVVIKPKDVANPRDMKEWAMGHGNCNFTGAIHELDALRTDMLVHCHRREIHKIQNVGLHHESGMWLFADCAFADDKANAGGRSDIILPDSNGTFWDKHGVGYYADASQDDGTSSFTLGVPKMMSHGAGVDNSTLFEYAEPGYVLMMFIHDLRNAQMAAQIGVEMGTGEAVMQTTEHVWDVCMKMQTGEMPPNLDALLAEANGYIPMIVGDKKEDVLFRDLLERKLTGLLLETMADDYKSAIGDYDAWLLIGGLLGSYAAPELVRIHNCHPGVAVFGPAGSGKSERIKMAMRLQGWQEQKMDLNSNATPIGISRTLAQYSAVSPFFDEFRRTNPNAETYQNLFRQASDRGVSAKGNIKNLTSTTAVTFRTTPVVGGENIFDDPATRTRFIAVQVQKARRDNPVAEAAYSRIKLARYHYYHIGRYALTWRRKFVTEFLANLDAFLKDTIESIPHDRVRLATGTGYAAYKSMATMLGVYKEDAEFREYAIKHGQRSSLDISDQTFRNTFWEDVTNLVLNRDSSIRIPLAFFDTEVKELPIDPANPDGAKRKVTVLYIAVHPIYPVWEEFCKRRGRSATMSLPNLRDEMSKEKYWLESPQKGSHTHYFPIESGEDGHASKKKRMRCWAIIAEDAPFCDDLFAALGHEIP